MGNVTGIIITLPSLAQVAFTHNGLIFRKMGRVLLNYPRRSCLKRILETSETCFWHLCNCSTYLMKPTIFTSVFFKCTYTQRFLQCFFFFFWLPMWICKTRLIGMYATWYIWVINPGHSCDLKCFVRSSIFIKHNQFVQWMMKLWYAMPKIHNHINVIIIWLMSAHQGFPPRLLSSKRPS